jgi:hypothetical protein
MSIIVTNHLATEFTNYINTVLGNINDRFRINLLPLNFQKTYYLQFVTKNGHRINTNKLLILTAPNFLDFSLTIHYLGITILIN